MPHGSRNVHGRPGYISRVGVTSSPDLGCGRNPRNLWRVRRFGQCCPRYFCGADGSRYDQGVLWVRLARDG